MSNVSYENFYKIRKKVLIGNNFSYFYKIFYEKCIGDIYQEQQENQATTDPSPKYMQSELRIKTISGQFWNLRFNGLPGDISWNEMP